MLLFGIKGIFQLHNLNLVNIQCTFLVRLDILVTLVSRLWNNNWHFDKMNLWS